MDIPNSGAIFTLGKSHLAENTQSYFYIRNDPVKRLISGPHQSAVICESGRLFVWGENHYGQLGIGGSNNSNGSSSNNSNNNSNDNNNSDNNGDTVTKPTCVKSLKTLGLKVADIAFGNDWAVMLTHSNELFFSGRNIFADESSAARNFTASTVAQEQCAIIRKPFRLEEFDDCLSASEEPENFVTVLAGNEHFAVMTSFGRLIGWGSNQRHQLGASTDDMGAPLQPHEMQLDAPIQQFTCGPESTLVLTENGSLYLTGRLNEFVFPQFTELQKNLAATEQIIFMHISKTSEIYIVTNAGSIYRSLESVRNKSLIFQRFYDYDSEENGPIWKLLKGTSFYTVLTKANKFYTTFSESGHHLKTFREISKFKNLRLLDMAVGEKHILVHGIPRSSTLSATVGPGGEHRFMSRSFVMAAAGAGAAEINANARSRSGRSISREKILEEEGEGGNGAGVGAVDGNGNAEVMKKESKETPKPNTPIHENGLETVEEPNAERTEVVEINAKVGKTKENLAEHENEQETKDASSHKNDTNANEQMSNGNQEESSDDESAEEAKNSNGRGATAILVEKTSSASTTAQISTEPVPSPQLNSPTASTKSIKSGKLVRSIKFEPTTVLEKSTSSDKLLRPRTPYPEGSEGSTPQTAKKTALRNYSYEAAMDHEFIEHTSPALVDNLENIPESTAGETVNAPVTAIISLPTPPTEEDEQLTVEITETTSSDAMDRTIVVNEIRFINNGVDVTANLKTEEAESADDDEEENLEEDSEGTQSIGIGDALEENTEQVRQEAENLLDQLNENIEETVQKVDKATLQVKYQVESALKETSEDVAERAETKLHETRDSIEAAEEKAATEARNAVDTVDENAGRLGSDARHAIATAAGGAKQAMGNAADGAKNTLENAGNSAMKAAGDAKNAAENAGNSAMHAVENAATGAKNAMGNAAEGAKNAMDNVGNSAMRAAGGAKHAVENAAHEAKNTMENAGNSAMKAAFGAKKSVENAGSSTMHAMENATHGAKHAMENAGSSAMKAAGGAKNSIENALFKMADGTKYAVDTVASKISNEMHEAKENIQSMFQGKDTDKDKDKDNDKHVAEVDEDDADVVSIKEDGDAVKTNTATTTTGGGEDDERTTASVNSNHNSSVGNPFDSGNPFENEIGGANPFENEADHHDDIVERGKQALRAEMQVGERQQVLETTEQSKGKVRQFFSDMRAKGRGMSCRNEKSIRIDDEPPRYSVEDELSTSRTVAVVNPGEQQNQNGSKVCVIL